MALIILSALETEVEELIPRPKFFPDENPQDYDRLYKSLMSDLAPETHYQRALATNLVLLDWEAIRHRRLRDNAINSAYLEIAASVFRGFGVEPPSPGVTVDKASKKAEALVFPEKGDHDKAVSELAALGYSTSDLLARAYNKCGKVIEAHDNRLAEIERRKRNLYEDYQRLKATNHRRIEKERQRER